MKIWKRQLVLAVLSFIVASAAVACGDDDDDDTTSDDDDADDDDADDDDAADDDTAFPDPFIEDFEEYELGAAPSLPWSLEYIQGDLTFTIVEGIAKDGSGQAVEMNDPGDGSWGELHANFPEQTGSFLLAWDWYWVSGEMVCVSATHTAAGGWTSLFDVCTSDTPDLQITAIDGEGQWIRCGDAALGNWQNVAVDVDSAAMTFSVLIDGAPSDCVDHGWYMESGPVDSLSLNSIGVYSGLAQFDNISLSHP